MIQIRTTPLDLFGFARSDAGRELTALALVALVVLLPAMLNGGPFIFFDTEQYYQIGKRILGALPGFTPAIDIQPDGQGPGVIPAADGGGGLAALAGGRSPTYSLLTALAAPAFTIWGVALIQAVACAWAIVRFCRFALGAVAPATVTGLALFLTFAAGLGFFAAFIMPDVFAGCLVLALAVYLFDDAAHTGRGKSDFWIIPLLMAAFASVHTTNLLLLVAAVPLTALIIWARGRDARAMWPRLAMMMSAFLAVVALNAGYGVAVKVLAGDQLGSPPFLLARTVADGTAQPYLADACAGAEKPWASCAFAGKEYGSENIFLWESDAEAVGFLSLPRAQKAAVQEEEKRLVAAIVLHDPLRQLGASMGNFVGQLFFVGIREISGGTPRVMANAGWSHSEILDHTPDAVACRDEGRLCAYRAWYAPWSDFVIAFNQLALPLGFLAVGFVVWRTWIGERVGGRIFGAGLSDREMALVCACALIVGLVVANAAVCGMLSGHNDRYQTRLIWSLWLAVACLAPVLRQLVLNMKRRPERPEINLLS